MKKTVLLSCTCLILLVTLAAAPAAAATLSSAATCPSSCSCLLPSEAAKAGSPGACGGYLQACAADAQGVRKFCYEKPAVKPPAVLATMVFMATTTAVPQACAAGCSCLGPEEGKAKNLPYCGGKQTLCSGSRDSSPRYCFAPAVTLTARTTTPAPVPIAPVKQVSLVAVPAASASGTPALPHVSARILATKPVTSTTTGAVPAQEGIFAGIAGIFGSLLGTSSSSSTSSRMISCNGTLTDLMADPANCGACGQTCPEGTCVMGTCRDRLGQMSRPCNRTETLCNGVCTEIMFNRNSCGNCTRVCGPNDGCCSGVCTNFTNYWNCGGCGIPCGGGSAHCTWGHCVCTDPEETLCPLGMCRNLREDERDCGTCGHACGEDETCCNGACTNTDRDNANCGECGIACNATEVCDNGRCVNMTSSRWNCGGRDITCRSGETCCSSRCVNLTSPESCGSSCADSVACPAGNLCCDRDCTEQSYMNCGSCGHRCAGYEDCCNGLCTGINTEDNCGSCGNRCGWYEMCTRGACHNGAEDFFWMLGHPGE